MTDIKLISETLVELNNLVKQTTLPKEEQYLISCLAPLLEKFSQLFDAEKNNEQIKMRHFAAIYGMLRMHRLQMQKELKSNRSSLSYLTSYVQPSETDLYLNALTIKLSILTPEFERYKDRKALKIEGYGEALHYEMGEEMQSEEYLSQPSSVAQLERRIYVFTYFHHRFEKINRFNNKLSYSAYAGNIAAALAFGPPGLLAGLAVTMYAAPKASAKVDSETRSFQRNAFESLIQDWSQQLQAILSEHPKARNVLELPLDSEVTTHDIKNNNNSKLCV